MPRPTRRSHLDIEEDRRFERASWTVQHYAWVAMLGLVVAGGLGYFGGGPFARVDAADPSGNFDIQYDRWLRRHALSTVDVRVRERPRASTLILWMSDAYAKQLRIESMTPQPQAQASGSGMVFYAFPPGPVAGAFSLHMEFRPQSLGALAGTIGVVEGPTAEFSQFVYP